MAVKRKTRKLRITHIDLGAATDWTFDGIDMILDPSDPGNTGAWPKVSFSDGLTFSYMYLTNTKILFFTADLREVITDRKYSALVSEFFDSTLEFGKSNWDAQRNNKLMSTFVETNLTRETVLV